MKRIVLPMMLVGVTFLNASTNQEIMAEGKAAIMKMGKTLKSHMKQNMKAGGPVQAAQFCSQEAVKIEKDVNKTYKKGIHVKRISLKYRNPQNKPTADEAKVLQQMQKEYKAGKKIAPMIVKQVATNEYKVYKPIFIAKNVCLVCHGDVATRSEAAYKIIHKKYPHDKAIDYKKGDLRGAFVADIVK
ncbi:Tll0287-like domain-containing protein [Sulfurimonas sp.]